MNNLKENDQLNAVEEIAGPAPEIPHACDQILKGGGGFWDDVNGGYLPEDLEMTARREEIEWVHSEGVEIDPKSVKMQARNCWSCSGWPQTSLWSPLTRKLDRDSVPGNTRRRSKARFNEPYLLLSCAQHCHHVKR